MNGGTTQKVLIIIPHLKIAGAQKMVEQLALHIDRSRWEVCVLVVSAPFHNSIEKRLTESGIQVHFLNKPMGFHMSFFHKVKKFIEAYDPDIIHTHMNGWMYAFPAAMARKITILHTIHSNPEKQESNWLARRLITFLYHRKAIIPVAISHGIRKDAEKVYAMPQEQIQLVYNPVDYDAFANEPKQPHKDVTFVNVARFDPVKNQQFLIRAFVKAWEKNKQIKLVLAGDGQLLESAKQLVKELDAEQAVTFLGNVDHVPQLLSGCDVFILPSLSEGLPVSMLEAEAAALPVIASRVGGIGDIVCDNGRLISVNDEEALIEAILELAQDEELRLKMGMQSQKIAQPYGARNIAQQYERLYAQFGRK